MLEARVDRLEAALEEMARALSILATDVGDLKGEALEARYRERAAQYFQSLMTRIRVVLRSDLEQMASDAEEKKVIAAAEHAELLHADLVIRGRARTDNADSYLTVEISSVVDSRDVERAHNRADLLQRITGMPVAAAVAGKVLSREAAAELSRLRVKYVQDGRLIDHSAAP